MPQAPQQDSFTTADGLNIVYRCWQPDGAARGVVVINHGFNSHSGQYLWVAEQFAAHGLAVYALDMRGRGLSDGERFHVETVDEHTADLHQLVTRVKAREPGLKVFLLGHSAGGVVSCVYSLDHQDELAGLICESFAFQVPAPDFALAVIKGVSHFAPNAPILHLKNEDFSRDPLVVKAMNEDPLIANETQPAITVAALVRADERLKAEFPNITLPVLILHGTLDKATRPSGSQLFHDTAGSSDKTLKLYEGHFHDLLNDLGKEDVQADIQSWIDARL